MTNQNQWLRRLNPAVSRERLLLLAGLMWSAVGVMLCRYAFLWLTRPLTTLTLVLGLAGAAVSLAANRFQFSRLALKNIERILQLNDPACLFAFQAWKGYLIIAVMMTGGILLRGSSIPRPYLAVPYAAVGGALLQASLHYFARLFTPRKAAVDLN